MVRLQLYQAIPVPQLNFTDTSTSSELSSSCSDSDAGTHCISIVILIINNCCHWL